MEIDENSPTLAQLAIAALDQVPMIWTTIGNVPASELEYRTAWEIHTDDDVFAGAVFTEEFYFNGECVKRSVHVYKQSGVAAECAVAGVGSPPLSH